MEESTSVSGKRASNTEKASLLRVMKRKKERGIMERYKNGQQKEAK